MKTPRNAACPCGSGKKYKRCCGAKGTSGFSREDEARARERLREFFDDNAEDQDACEAFFAFQDEPKSTRDLRERFELGTLEVLDEHFRDFALLDHPDVRGRRLVDRWLQAHGSALPPGERRYFEVLRRAVVGVYEITRLESARVELRDLWLGGAPRWVAGAEWLSRGARVGDWLAVRLLEVRGELRAAGAQALLFQVTSPEGLLSELRKKYEELRVSGLEISARALLEMCAPLVVEHWIEEWRARRRKAYPHTTVELSQALDEHGGLRHLRADDRRMILYWGRVAYQASSLEPDRPSALGVHCRRRPGNYPCEASLMAKRPAPDAGVDPDSIEWWCPACEDSGTLQGWRGSAFDSSVRATGTRSRASTSVPLTTAEWNLLNKQTCALPAAALDLLVGAYLTPSGGSLRGDPQAFEQLTAALESLLESRSGVSMTAGLSRLHRKLSGAAGRRPYRTPQRVADPQELFEEAPAARAPVNRGPRPVADESRPNLVLEVRLEHVLPPVLRSLLVPSRTTLAELHAILQAAMGWEDCHLHHFEVGGELYGLPSPESHVAYRDSRAALLVDCLREEGDTLAYTYDFGDDWRHTLTLVSTINAECSRPQLLSGSGACPPEDCGGPAGYQHLCAVLADPEDPEYETLSEWVGDDLDPQCFDRAAHARRVAAAVEC